MSSVVQLSPLTERLLTLVPALRPDEGVPYVGNPAFSLVGVVGNSLDGSG